MNEVDWTRPFLEYIPGGGFEMGSLRGRDDEMPPHRVIVASFRMFRFPVTNREYGEFLRESSCPPPPTWRDPGFNHLDQPVVSVNWFDAVAFCKWLSRRLGDSCRLPTEAEREYACRAGSSADFPWGDAPEHNHASIGDYVMEAGPAIVGGRPNAWGLCNMNDNVHEWCLDWYGKDYYSVSPVQNPSGPASGKRRASRGGSWRHQMPVTRSSARSAIDPAFRYADYGFRPIVEPVNSR